MTNRHTPKINRPSFPFLVYTSAGQSSKFKQWISKDKTFDLWITNYQEGNAEQRDLADFYNVRKGGKYPNLYHIYKNYGNLINHYKAIFVLDDDIEISCKQISHLFRILERYELNLLQPSFSVMGKISHPITISRLIGFARYTNFVENGVALFSKPILDKFMQVYDPKLVAFGTDWWYLHIMTDAERSRIAVIDSITCINPDERLEKRSRDIDTVEPVSTGLQIWEEIKKEQNIKLPQDGVKTLGKLWPKALEDWITLLTVHFLRVKTFFLYPHYYMRAKRFYWRIFWRIKGSRHAW